jgi:hypothetical protein
MAFLKTIIIFILICLVEVARHRCVVLIKRYYQSVAKRSTQFTAYVSTEYLFPFMVNKT